jgi:hypothetical protein
LDALTGDVSTLTTAELKAEVRRREIEANRQLQPSPLPELLPHAHDLLAVVVAERGGGRWISNATLQPDGQYFGTETSSINPMYATPDDIDWAAWRRDYVCTACGAVVPGWPSDSKRCTCGEWTRKPHERCDARLPKRSTP